MYEKKPAASMLRRSLALIGFTLAGGVTVVAPATSAHAAVDAATGEIVFSSSPFGHERSQCLDVPGSLADGVRVQLAGCNGSDAQKWTTYTDKTIRIGAYVNGAQSLCLDVAGGSTAENAAVQVATCNGGNAQKWEQYSCEANPCPDHAFGFGKFLITPVSGKYLTPDPQASGQQLLKISGSLNEESLMVFLPKLTKWAMTSAATSPGLSIASPPTFVADSDRGTTVAKFSGNQLATSGGVLDSRGSFSVSAWVKLDSIPNHNMTALSQEGSSVSTFYLGYDASSGKWSFKRMASDADNAWGVDALSAGNAVAGTWVHLMGVYNSYYKTVQLYVNGTLQSTQNISTPWGRGAGSVFYVGAAKWNGADADFWSGRISSVRIWPFALNSYEADQVYING